LQNHKSVMVLRYTRKTIQGVVAYFFTAKHNDREAVGFFINHLELFNVCKLGGLNPSPSGEDFSII